METSCSGLGYSFKNPQGEILIELSHSELDVLCTDLARGMLDMLYKNLAAKQ